jgi:hypothetical protein
MPTHAPALLEHGGLPDRQDRERVRLDGDGEDEWDEAIHEWDRRLR